MKPIFLLMLCVFALAISITRAQDTSAFVSIDCGLPSDSGNYNDDTTGIPYSIDAAFIDTGNISNIDRAYITNSLPRQLWTVRSFPRDLWGSRNCYNLTAVQGKGKKYLIRATFMYGNYDGKNQTTMFDLHLGVERWVTVTLSDATSTVDKEIIHAPSSDYFYVCLVNLGKGTPFISALELRPLNQGAYPTKNDSGLSLLSFVRENFAPVDPNKQIRYPADHFDRLWAPFPMFNGSVSLNTTQTINVANGYDLPQAVMQTAVTTENVGIALTLSWSPPDPNVQYYTYMHFAEVVKLQRNETRAFEIDLGNIP